MLHMTSKHRAYAGWTQAFPVTYTEMQASWLSVAWLVVPGIPTQQKVWQQMHHISEKENETPNPWLIQL